MSEGEVYYYGIVDSEGRYMRSSGYYGNECSINGFATREAAQIHINTYYSGKRYRTKRMRVMK